jgi:uncharacterized membrane protein
MEPKTDAASKVVTGHRTPVVTITVTAVFTALVFLSTYLFQIPIPATQGYFNLGDIMIFISALTFGPIVGGFAGGVGSFLSDALGGFGSFAPFTLIIKGSEGFVAGLISRRSVQRRTLMLAWAAGSVIMVLGYFLAESFLIALFFGSSSATGIVAASGEVPFNILQVVGGGAVGIPVSIVLKLAFRSTPYFSRMIGPVGGRQAEKN